MGRREHDEFDDDFEGESEGDLESDLEDEDGFNYDEFVEREFGAPLRSKSVPLHWQMVAMGLVVVFAFSIWFSLGLWTPF